MTRATLLFAHGARDPRWAEPFAGVAARIRAADPGHRVELAFLELMRPDLREAAAALAGAGATRIDVVPLFLGSGGHVRRDLPALLATLRDAHRDVDFRLHGAVGESDAVIEAMARTALDASRSE